MERVLAERRHARQAHADELLENLRMAILIEDVFDVVLTDHQLTASLDADDLRALLPSTID